MTLKLSNNRIKFIQYGLFNLIANLTVLQLDGNSLADGAKLENINCGFLTTMIELDLSGSEFSELPHFGLEDFSKSNNPVSNGFYLKKCALPTTISVESISRDCS